MRIGWISETAGLADCSASRKEEGSGHLYARVLYSGQPMKTIRGLLDWLPLDALIDILTPYVPDDIIALCNS